MSAFTLLKAVQRAVGSPTGVREAAVYGGTADPDAAHSDFRWYRRAGGGRRDLPEYTWRQIVERAIVMAQAHPLGSRYVTLLCEVAGGPYTLSAKDERVLEVLRRFWDHPANAWAAWMPSYLMARATAGTLVFPVTVLTSGFVRVTYADPADVVEVEANGQDPRRVETIVLQPKGSGQKYPLRVVNPILEGPYEGRLMGEDPRAQVVDASGVPRPHGALYFRFGGLPNQTRGTSDFSASVDQLAVLDEFFAADMERALVLSKIAADVTVEDGQPGEIADVASRYKNIPGFAVFGVHNQREKVNLQVPSTGAAEFAERERAYRQYACAPFGVPPNILAGDLDQGNRALTTGPTDAAYYRIQARVREMEAMARFACQYAVDTAVMTGRLLRGLDETFSVDGPNVLKRDVAQGAKTLGDLVLAASAAEDKGYLDAKTARRVVVGGLPEVGVEDVTVDAVEQAVAADEASARASGAVRQGALADALASTSRRRGGLSSPGVLGGTPAAVVGFLSHRASSGWCDGDEHPGVVVLKADCGTGAGGFKPSNTCGRGEGAGALGARADRITGTPGKGGRPHYREWVAPPVPRGRPGGSAGGYSATGRTNTEIGDRAEAAMHAAGFKTALQPGKRQGPFDIQWDDSDMVFEVKAQTTMAAEYKVKMKAAELAGKIRAARRLQKKPGTMIVVIDHEDKHGYVYWREGLGNYRLNPAQPVGWHYAGSVAVA